MTSTFLKPGEQVEYADMSLVRCNDCGLVQLKQVYDKDYFYKNEIYGYRSGQNKSMVSHLRDVVNIAKRYVALDTSSAVLDIGSNDGTLLGHYPDWLRRVGIDPTISKFSKYYKPGIEQTADYFSPDKVNGKFNVITALSMLYDLEDPMKFVKDVASVLSHDGVVIFEQGYVLGMIDNNSYDTICHEHVEYYGVKQIKWMADRAGLVINHIETNGVNGGSFLVVLSKGGVECAEVAEYIAREDGIDFSAFIDFIEGHKDALVAVLKRLRAAGKKVVGYGASTKGNTLLQVCGIDATLLPCIVEVNEEKIGRVTPGTNIPIVAECEADYYLVLPWHFRDNILSREKDKKFIFPLPEIEIT
jgi:SAM-dependent methyltransferase